LDRRKIYRRVEHTYVSFCFAFKEAAFFQNEHIFFEGNPMASTECVLLSSQISIAQFKTPHIIDCNTNLTATISKVMFVCFYKLVKFFFR